MSQDDPFFTVVIPTYNHGALIGACLESLRRQTFARWHAVVINNHSADNTEEVVRGFADARISLVNFHNHGIIAASRNEGLRHARGEYVAFLDSDDEWLPTKLATVFREIQRSSPVLVSHLLWQRDNATGTVRLLDSARTYPFSYANLLLYGNHLMNSATVVNRAFLRAHDIRLTEDPGFVTCEDYDLWLRCARLGATYAFVDEILGIYAVASGSGSGNYVRHLDRVRQLVRWHCRSLQTFASPRWLEFRALAAIELTHAAREWQCDRRRAALQHGVAALIHNPVCVLRYLQYSARRYGRLRRFPPPAGAEKR